MAWDAGGTPAGGMVALVDVHVNVHKNPVVVA